MQISPTFPNVIPQLLLVLELIEMCRQLHLSGANVPKQNTERINVHTGVVAAAQ